jgi:hypothetical protein
VITKEIRNSIETMRVAEFERTRNNKKIKENAQTVTVNQRVVGSSPTGGAERKQAIRLLFLCTISTSSKLKRLIIFT